MKRLAVTILILIALTQTSIAQQTDYERPRQQNTTRPSRDSLRYYRTELNKYVKSSWDSIRRTETYLELMGKMGRGRDTTSRYNGFMLFSEVVHSDYRDFNQSIAQSGFSPLKSTMTRIGFGISSKNEQRIFEFHFGVFGIRNQAKKDQEKIRTSLDGVLEIVWGYDLIKSRQVDFYPYAGLGLRMSSIEYKKPAEVNSSFTDISNIVINDPSVDASSTRLGYTAGFGLDIKLTRREQLNRSPMFFTKFGINQPFGKDKFDIEGISYRPGFKQADWLLSFGFKFLARTR